MLNCKGMEASLSDDDFCGEGGGDWGGGGGQGGGVVE